MIDEEWIDSKPSDQSSRPLIAGHYTGALTEIRPAKSIFYF